MPVGSDLLPIARGAMADYVPADGILDATKNRRDQMTERETTTLYRPVGQAELDLIAAAGWRAFPPRLPHQPIFYPVLSEDYAVQIARDWNTRDAASGYVGYVTRFAVDAEYLSRFQVETVGSHSHRELWVPAEELDEFNCHIVGLIEVIAEFRPGQGE